MHPAMGGQITRNSFYGKTSLAGFSACVTVVDGGFFHLEMGTEFGKRQHGASVRVKDGGVLAAQNTFTLKVDKFLAASGSHDSLFSHLRPSSAHCENPPLLHDITKKKKKEKKQVSCAKFSF